MKGDKLYSAESCGGFRCYLVYLHQEDGRTSQKVVQQIGDDKPIQCKLHHLVFGSYQTVSMLAYFDSFALID